MYGPLFPDLSIQITRRRRRFVLDPNLSLSRDDAMLARLLAPYAEQWVGTEFFNVLDSATLYQHEPELLVWPSTDGAANRRGAGSPARLDAAARRSGEIPQLGGGRVA